MKSKRTRLFVAVALSALLGACAGKVTGGGTFASSSGVAGQKANFGFIADSCDIDAGITSHVNFHDKSAPGFQPGGIKFRGEVTGILHLPNAVTTGDQTYLLTVAYQSTNPNFKGSGVATVVVVDNGQGAAALPDAANVTIESGPFAGATIEGYVSGNVQSHACE